MNCDGETLSARRLRRTCNWATLNVALKQIAWWAECYSGRTAGIQAEGAVKFQRAQVDLTTMDAP